MIPRYTLAEMAAIWSDEARFEAMLLVELAVARAEARRGQVPADAARAPGTSDVLRPSEVAEVPTPAGMTR